MSLPIAYIRVAIVSENQRGEVRCMTVNEQGQAFDGARFFPGYLVAHKDAIVESPIEQTTDPCLIHYGGQVTNRKQVMRHKQGDTQ